MRIFTFTLLALTALSARAQLELLDEVTKPEKPRREYVRYTFKTTRVINGQSVETTPAKALDFRISHRFGDIAATPNDHIHSLFGFDQASDILFVFEYGVTDHLTLGAGRAKGAGPLRELWNGSIKYRALRQTKDFKIPLTITLYANAAVSSMRGSGDATQVAYFPANTYAGFANRWSYTVQALMACKATEWLSVQLTPAFVWRNRVPYNDQNALFSLGISGRTKFNKRSGVVFEYFLPIQKAGTGGRQYFPMLRGMRNAPYYPCLHIGLEFETGGHVFHINFTNSRGMLDQDFLPYNTANWLQGAFRIGFTISRTFQLNQKNAKYWKKGSVED
ncbi:MAG: DUF5777 family beta-barrel protein [Chitinophagales bacterium]|nr:DUF5777 family beta-barrel protein [Chitinophagales bacterium]